MSNNQKLKDLVAEIKKLADAAPPPPPGAVINTAPPGAPGAGGPPQGGGRPAQVRNQAVMAMQDAMRDLADAVTRDATSQTMFRRPGDARQQQSPTANPGKAAFNNFLAEQYVGALDNEHRGVEYSTNPNVNTRADKTQSRSDIYEMDVVMNTLKRIGTPDARDGEFKSDGVWQFRTDNALKNMYGFARALLAFSSDFPGIESSYTNRQLDSFYDLISGYQLQNGVVKMSEQDKTNRANQITKHLKGIIRMYNDFRRQFLSRPAIRSLIEGSRALDKTGPDGSNSNVLNETETAIANKQGQTVMTDITGYKDGKPYRITALPLTSLKDKNSFEEYLKSIGYTAQSGPLSAVQQAPKVLAQIQAVLDERMKQRQIEF